MFREIFTEGENWIETEMKPPNSSNKIKAFKNNKYLTVFGNNVDKKDINRIEKIVIKIQKADNKLGEINAPKLFKELKSLNVEQIGHYKVSEFINEKSQKPQNNKWYNPYYTAQEKYSNDLEYYDTKEDINFILSKINKKYNINIGDTFDTFEEIEFTDIRDYIKQTSKSEYNYPDLTKELLKRVK